MGLGDARTLATLRRHFGGLYLKDPPVVYDDQVAGRDLGAKTFITLGGPFSNRVYRTVNEALRLSWRFEFDTPENFAIIDRYTDERFAPQQDSNGFLVRDYGLIVRCRSPFGARETNQYVYVFAGCYGYGTQAAVEYATYTNAL